MEGEGGREDRVRAGFYDGLIGWLDVNGVPTDESLLAYAANEMALGALQDDGVALRVHLESVWRQTGKLPEGLIPINCPDSVKYLWGYFLDMCKRRTSNGFGVNPITDEGVEAWARRRGLHLTRFEQRALDALEQLYLATRAKDKK